jgi:putative membrane protein
MATHPHDNDDDAPLGVPGVPRNLPPSAPTETPVAAPAADVPTGERPGDSGLGVPSSTADAGRMLTAAELAALEAADAQRDRDEAERVYEQLVADHAGFRLPAFIRNALGLALVAFIGFFGFFVVTQIPIFFAQISVLAPWAQYLVLGLFFVFTTALLLVVVRMAWMFGRLRVNRQVQVGALRDLADRRNLQMRSLAREKLDDAKRELTAYLRSFPLTSDAERKTLKRLHATDAEISELVTHRDSLLNPNLDPGAEAWIENFRRFQSVLDTIAARRIGATRWQVAVATAASPYPMLDLSIVLYHGFALVHDLCKLFNLRTSNAATATILGRVMVSAYVAGNLQALSDEGGRTIAEELSAQLGSVGAKILGSVGAKVGEGAVNALLIGRVGRRTVTLLRPVAPPRG